VAGDRRIGRRFTLILPSRAATPEPPRLLVLLHGLGETGDERAGVYAWLERYGLADAYRRLLRPPLQPQSRLPYWPEGRLAELNASLAARPFRAPVIACPYTPNVNQASDRRAMLDAYADWLVAELLPRARREAGLAACAARTSLDGCSLGGHVGIEVFLRKPEHFGAWGSVQGAFGSHRIAGYADGLAAAVARPGGRRIHLETSSDDSFRAVNVELSRALGAHGVPHELRLGRGPHSQPWLREAGTLEMLLWHERLG
jgi:enterochelin esterase-like enzyme